MSEEIDVPTAIRAMMSQLDLLAEKASDTNDKVSALLGLQDRVLSLERGWEEARSVNLELRKTITLMEEKIDDLENRERRNNLLFFGFEEAAWETWDQTLRFVEESVARTMGITISSSDIERAHRLGRRIQGKTRPIIVKFSSFRTKLEILRRAGALRGTGFGVAEDFSKLVREQRRGLLPFYREARDAGRVAKLMYNKLYIGGTAFVFRNGTLVPSNVPSSGMEYERCAVVMPGSDVVRAGSEPTTVCSAEGVPGPRFGFTSGPVGSRGPTGIPVSQSCPARPVVPFALAPRSAAGSSALPVQSTPSQPFSTRPNMVKRGLSLDAVPGLALPETSLIDTSSQIERARKVFTFNAQKIKRPTDRAAFTPPGGASGLKKLKESFDEPLVPIAHSGAAVSADRPRLRSSVRQRNAGRPVSPCTPLNPGTEDSVSQEFIAPATVS